MMNIYLISPSVSPNSYLTISASTGAHFSLIIDGSWFNTIALISTTALPFCGRLKHKLIMCRHAATILPKASFTSQ